MRGSRNSCNDRKAVRGDEELEEDNLEFREVMMEEKIEQTPDNLDKPIEKSANELPKELQRQYRLEIQDIQQLKKELDQKIVGLFKSVKDEFRSRIKTPQNKSGWLTFPIKDYKACFNDAR